MRWSRREVSGVYFASGPPPCCLRVFFQGCSQLSRHPASRKFCRKWFTAVMPTLRGSRSRTSFSMSVFTRSMRICISFASIDVFFCRFFCHLVKKRYICRAFFWCNGRCDGRTDWRLFYCSRKKYGCSKPSLCTSSFTFHFLLLYVMVYRL